MYSTTLILPCDVHPWLHRYSVIQCKSLKQLLTMLMSTTYIPDKCMHLIVCVTKVKAGSVFSNAISA